MKQHTIKGCEILQNMPDIMDNGIYNYSYDICRHHHERWDGRGYPDGLTGDDISIWAQVVAVADVYDALTSERRGDSVAINIYGEQEGNRHYWLLCNLGTGWYHFDATRIRGGFTCFMLTDAPALNASDAQPSWNVSKVDIPSLNASPMDV